jgi:NAD(P)-dependent dehydrogenase (short-subunit alcohol dehydrogenase family)
MRAINQLSPFPLTGKNALVVGASQGIGAAISARLASAGAHVILAARNQPNLRARIEEIRKQGGSATAIPVDVTEEESIRTLIAEIEDRFKTLDVAVNNAAGGGRSPAPLAEWTSDEFDSSVAVDLRGVFLCLKYEIQLFRKTGTHGAIVNMSSTAGEQGVAGLAGYVASKFGVGGLTRVAALDYAADGIRVNAIAPGPILTDRLSAAGQKAQDGVAASIPLKRIGHPEDIAEAALWLCTEASSFVTGTVLTVDGGKLAGTPAYRR